MQILYFGTLLNGTASTPSNAALVGDFGMSAAMPQRMSVSPSCHHQVLLRFLNSFFPDTPVFVPRFSGKFQIFFSRTLTERQMANFAHRVYRQKIPQSGRDSRKKSSLFTPPTALRLVPHTGYIWGQKRNPIEILRKNLPFFVASAVRDRSAHSVYQQKTEIR